MKGLISTKLCILRLKSVKQLKWFAGLFLLPETVHLELSIFFCWVPGHIGIPGNEQVDDLAKLAVNLTVRRSQFFSRI